MPLPFRDLTATVVRPQEGGAVADVRERALEVLLGPALAPVVALVCWRDGDLVEM